jgi:hypothetical protein
MKNLKKSISDDETCEASFLYFDKVFVDLKKNFSVEESAFIINKADECKSQGKVNWAQLLTYFNYDSSVEAVLKKIRGHYYNVRSKPARKASKVLNYHLEKLGFQSK